MGCLWGRCQSRGCASTILCTVKRASTAVPSCDCTRNHPGGTSVFALFAPRMTHPFGRLSSLGGARSETGGEQPLRGLARAGFTIAIPFPPASRCDKGRGSSTRSPLMSSWKWRIRRCRPCIRDGRVARCTAAQVGGLAFRAIARPFVVGYVDIGFGSEGPAGFSGIYYPF